MSLPFITPAQDFLDIRFGKLTLVRLGLNAMMKSWYVQYNPFSVLSGIDRLRWAIANRTLSDRDRVEAGRVVDTEESCAYI